MALSCFLAAIVAQGPKGITYDNSVHFVYNTLAFPANFFYRPHHIGLVYLDGPAPVRVIFLDQILLLPWPLQTRNVEIISVTLEADFGLRVVYNLIEAAPAFVYFQIQPISDWTLLFTRPSIERLELIIEADFGIRVVFNLSEAATTRVYFLPLPIVVPTYFMASSSSVVKSKLLKIHPPTSLSEASKTFTTIVSTLASTTIPQKSIGLTPATPPSGTLSPNLITATATTVTTVTTFKKTTLLHLITKPIKKAITTSPLSTVLPSQLTTALQNVTTITANSVTTTSLTSATKTVTTIASTTTTKTSTSTERRSPKVTTTTPRTMLTSSAVVIHSTLSVNHFNLILISFAFIYQIK